MLTILNGLPEGLLEVEARQLATILPGPSLIHLPGRREPALFVSILLHGNESTGLLSVQQVLRRHLVDGRLALPRALTVLVGNVAAAAGDVRSLDGQPDYNRIWPGDPSAAGPEAEAMREVVRQMRARGVFASVDIHNNTGMNPHYACLNRLDQRFFHLAVLFSRTVVYFIRPSGVQSAAFAEFCPAVTLECGKVGDQGGVDHASQFIDACLHMAQLPQHPLPPQDIDLFHTVATIRVPRAVSFGFGEGATDLLFAPDLDRLNFRELPEGTVLARLRRGGIGQVEVRDEAGLEVTERYFEVIDGELRTRVPVMPSMFTRDERVIRQDCLGYLMERYPLAASHVD